MKINSKKLFLKESTLYHYEIPNGSIEEPKIESLLLYQKSTGQYSIFLRLPEFGFLRQEL